MALPRTRILLPAVGGLPWTHGSQHLAPQPRGIGMGTVLLLSRPRCTGPQPQGAELQDPHIHSSESLWRPRDPQEDDESSEGAGAEVPEESSGNRTGWHHAPQSTSFRLLVPGGGRAGTWAGEEASRNTGVPGPPASSPMRRRGLGQAGRPGLLPPRVLAVVSRCRGHVPESDHCTAPGPTSGPALWPVLPCQATASYVS